MKQLTICTEIYEQLGICSVMSDMFLYSGDDVVMMSELQHCHAAGRECSVISSGSKAGLSVGTSVELAPEYSLTFPQECTCAYANPYLHIYSS